MSDAQIRGQKVVFTFNVSRYVVGLPGEFGFAPHRVEVIDYGYKAKIVATTRSERGRPPISKTFNLSGYEQHPAPPDSLQELIKEARQTMGENPPEKKVIPSA